MPRTSTTAQGIDADQAKAEVATNRQFIGMVRARLDADGYRDVPVSRQWIDEDTPGFPFLLNVPVGPALVVPLKPRDAFFRTGGGADLASHAEHFAKALVTLRQAEGMLVKYAADMRRAAAKAIAAARAEDLDVSLADVEFKPTYAWHLTGGSWKEAAYHILAVVRVRHTSFFLRPTISGVYVEEPEHVAKELEDIFADEAERRGLLAGLDASGADLIVDAVTLDLLRTHVADVGQALRDAWKNQHVDIPISYRGFETSLSLVTSEGSVESKIALPDAYWNGEMLWLLGDNVENGMDVLGRTLAGKVSHPALSCRKVVRVDARPTATGGPDCYHLDLGERHLFDADTGRIRPAPTSMAA